LILNPEARGVTPAIARVVEAALEGRFKLDTTTTHARDAAVQVARDAAGSGVDLIVAFGGDGLVNEVVNGMATGHEQDRPALAVIPGGTMNVFARNHGLPKDPLDATDLILQRSDDFRTKKVKLGKVNERYFTFVFGAGFDAEAAARVEEHKTTKRRFGEPYFFAAALATFMNSYFTKKPFMTVETPQGRSEAVMAIALTGPTYAYLAGRPIHLTGKPRSDPSGLDLFVLNRLRYSRLPTYATGALFSGRFGKESSCHLNLERTTITGDAPFAVHVDGEPLPRVASAEVSMSDVSIDLLV